MRIINFNPDGTVAEDYDDGIVPSDEPLSNAERFAQLPADQAEAILTLSVGLLMEAGPVWDATTAMSDDTPGKAALLPIAGALLDAALPLLDPET